MEPTTRIHYERLFNLGNFEHEKFVVSKELTLGEDIPEGIKELVVLIADLEDEAAGYRVALQDRRDLLPRHGWQGTSEEDKSRMEKRLKQLNLIITAFKDDHKPANRGCKCYYCQHPEEGD
jgi:hypothetical protein